MEESEPGAERLPDIEVEEPHGLVPQAREAPIAVFDFLGYLFAGRLQHPPLAGVPRRLLVLRELDEGCCSEGGALGGGQQGCLPSVRRNAPLPTPLPLPLPLATPTRVRSLLAYPPYPADNTGTWARARGGWRLENRSTDPETQESALRQGKGPHLEEELGFRCCDIVVGLCYEDVMIGKNEGWGRLW